MACRFSVWPVRCQVLYLMRKVTWWPVGFQSDLSDVRSYLVRKVTWWPIRFQSHLSDVKSYLMRKVTWWPVGFQSDLSDVRSYLMRKVTWWPIGFQSHLSDVRSYLMRKVTWWPGLTGAGCCPQKGTRPTHWWWTPEHTVHTGQSQQTHLKGQTFRKHHYTTQFSQMSPDLQSYLVTS